MTQDDPALRRDHEIIAMTRRELRDLLDEAARQASEKTGEALMKRLIEEETRRWGLTSDVERDELRGMLKFRIWLKERAGAAIVNVGVMLLLTGLVVIMRRGFWTWLAEFGRQGSGN